MKLSLSLGSYKNVKVFIHWTFSLLLLWIIISNFRQGMPGMDILWIIIFVLALFACVVFHEFGHALHSILSQVKYKSLAGTNVLWDFVELPSQLLENWCYEKLSLQKFAFHYETNEVIPDDLVERIKKSMQYRSASANLRQVGLATLDLKWHTTAISDDTNVVEFERKALQETDLYAAVENCIISTQFGHIFQGGYAAGYYSYKWAEILEADVFESFEEAGVLNASLAEKLVNEILSKGGTQNPETLFINFKGRAPKPDALLKKMGLV